MSDVITGQGPAETDESNNDGMDTAEGPENAPDAQLEGGTDKPADGDTFPRSYVEELRSEAADHRTKAKAAEDRADALAKRLHAELVKATNRLENHADLAYDFEHLDDPEKLTAALDALLADRPYMAKRVVKGDAGQGNRGDADNGVNLLEMLRGSR